MDWLIVILLGIMSLYLLSGRGAMLIAGYNTATEEEKLRYDEKKLCRTVGVYLGILTVLVAVRMWYDSRGPEALDRIIPCLIVICTVVVVLYTNFGGCTRSSQEVEQLKILLNQRDDSARQAERKEARRQSLSVLLVLTAMGTLAFGLLMCFGGQVTLTLERQELVCKADFAGKLRLPYSEIQGAELCEALETGEKVDGIHSFRLSAGKFKNGELGEYYRYSYVDGELQILLETTKGPLVLSLENEEATRSFFVQLRDRLDAETPRMIDENA